MVNDTRKMMANEYKLQTWILAYSSLVFVVTSRDVLSETVLNDWRELAVLFYEINCEFYLQHREKTLMIRSYENTIESIEHSSRKPLQCAHNQRTCSSAPIRERSAA